MNKIIDYLKTVSAASYIQIELNCATFYSNPQAFKSDLERLVEEKKVNKNNTYYSLAKEKR